MFLGLRTAIYPAPDLAAAKAWFTRMLGVEPYFDEPFYVGYSIAGYELALDPNGDPARGVVTYWGVPDAAIAVAKLVDDGATVDTDVTEVGGGIKVATLTVPGGGLLGVIENPHFELAAPPAIGDGPGR